MSRADILQGLLVCLVMILTLFIGFLIEHSGTQVLQEAGTALLRFELWCQGRPELWNRAVGRVGASVQALLCRLSWESRTRTGTG